MPPRKCVKLLASNLQGAEIKTEKFLLSLKMTKNMFLHVKKEQTLFSLPHPLYEEANIAYQGRVVRKPVNANPS